MCLINTVFINYFHIIIFIYWKCNENIKNTFMFVKITVLSKLLVKKTIYLWIFSNIKSLSLIKNFLGSYRVGYFVIIYFTS